MKYQIDYYGQHYSCSMNPRPVQSTAAFITQQNVMILSLLLLLIDLQISLLGMVYFQQNMLLVHLFLLVCNLFFPHICFLFLLTSYLLYYLWALHFLEVHHLFSSKSTG